YVLLTVSDTGHGMDHQTLQKIFDPFFTTKSVGKGTGLGLASVYGIVKGHDGEIICYSEVGQGTTFKIYFPIIEASSQEPEQLAIMEIPKGENEKILIVDDEAPIREMAVAMLQRFDYQVISAESGEKALEIYQLDGSGIDLVILDLSMPGMGGHKCLRDLLKIDPDAKVVIASGYSASGQVKKTLESGAAGYVEKPYQLKDLIDNVRAVLNGKA
ncbi:MAG: response regulator, partial [Deltaproteobacteria bacterium]|nr:response regulator [Deltaproteobacteria bacterium]